MCTARSFSFDSLATPAPGCRLRAASLPQAERDVQRELGTAGSPAAVRRDFSLTMVRLFSRVTFQERRGMGPSQGEVPCRSRSRSLRPPPLPDSRLGLRRAQSNNQFGCDTKSPVLL